MDIRGCEQHDPHCPENYGDKCERGCYEVVVDTREYEHLTIIRDTAIKFVESKQLDKSDIRLCRLINACLDYEQSICDT